MHGSDACPRFAKSPSYSKIFLIPGCSVGNVSPICTSLVSWLRSFCSLADQCATATVFWARAFSAVRHSSSLAYFLFAPSLVYCSLLRRPFPLPFGCYLFGWLTGRCTRIGLSFSQGKLFFFVRFLCCRFVTWSFRKQPGLPLPNPFPDRLVSPLLLGDDMSRFDSVVKYFRSVCKSLIHALTV